MVKQHVNCRMATEGMSLKQEFSQRLAAIEGQDLLFGGLKGVEKESLRVSADGRLAMTPHPAGLGSALTNRYITTDFSEALLEFVTPAFPNTWEALRCICDIHQFTYAQLADELLWSASMPCVVPKDELVPLAKYGTSNVGRMKTIYRRGLGHRYGRQMQTIAGVHFNYSLPETFWPAYKELLGESSNTDEFRSEQYLALIRNFRRMGWLVLYLFGASPALCKSFAAGHETRMKSLNNGTFYEPYGTSLRMSDLGYSNQNQSRINISLNSLDEYVRGLSAAIETPEPSYEEIGVKVDGHYRQLNANLLQIENEFYSSVRPKRVANSGEQPTAALRRGGIQYVEIRSIDINPFDPCGINQNTMRFMEAFLIYCLLQQSPKLSQGELDEVVRNHTDTAKYGRDPEFRLLRGGDEVRLADWASEILDGVHQVAEEIDRHEANSSYADAVKAMRKLVDNPEETLSASIVNHLIESDSDFFHFALDLTSSHRDYFNSIASLSDERLQEFAVEARESVSRQEAIEASDTLSLDEYLERYFNRR